MKGMSEELMKLPLPALALISAIGISSPAQAVEVEQPLILESTIPLPNVWGRIDHLAVDLVGNRLFVAELDNNTLDVINLSVQKVLHRISNLVEPQGVAYVSEPGLIAVANGGDGKVCFFNGSDFSPRGTISLSDDADNVRVDPRSGYVLVGFGTSQIAIIDPTKPEWLSNIPLPLPSGKLPSFVIDRPLVRQCPNCWEDRDGRRSDKGNWRELDDERTERQLCDGSRRHQPGDYCCLSQSREDCDV
jgi:DNA-binding beta-propeller fold protein YncE